MTRRLTTWLTVAALIQQLGVPAMAATRATDAGLAICTSNGLVTVPGQPSPFGATDRSGLKHGGCHAICQCSSERRRHPTGRR